MKINKYWLILLCSTFSISLFAQGSNKKDSLKSFKNQEIKNVTDSIYLPFRTKKVQLNSITSSISNIDVDNELNRDTRWGVSSSYANKIPGLLWGQSIRDYGSATFVVDGVVWDNINTLKLQEVESVVVLKDISARMLYGTDGDAGVIQIKTKKGIKNSRSIKFDFESGINKAISYPDLLDAATNMELHNIARRNDNSNSALYDDQLIQNTRNHVDNVLYPDVNYYGKDFVRDITHYESFYGEVSGGDNKTRYFMNLGANTNQGWMNIGDNTFNSFNVKGKVDTKILDWLSVNTDINVVFNVNKTSNVGDYWSQANSTLPQQQALLIPIDRIEDPTSYAPISVIDNKYLLAGSTVYQSNLYGDLTRKGNATYVERLLKGNLGFDFDFNQYVKGLSASAKVGFDFYNTFSDRILNQYSVYSVVPGFSNDELFVTRINDDIITTRKSVDDNSMNYYRNTHAFLHVNYDRTFGKHVLSAVLANTYRRTSYNSQYQIEKKFTSGLQANYSYDGKYLLDVAAVVTGSAKLDPNNQYGLSKSIGLGWIASNENFLKNNKTISYLKVRANYGELLNDNWSMGSSDGYLMYEPLYRSQWMFNYNYDGTRNNKIYSMNSSYNSIGWQRRKELDLGVDMYLFNNSTWFEATYFNSKKTDLMTDMTWLSPTTFGNMPRYENYNSTTNSGVEIGVKYSTKIHDFNVILGANYLYTYTKYDKFAELRYLTPETQHLSMVGENYHGLRGFQAVRYYMPSDFDSDGDLINPPYENSFGSVKVGDIMYQDYNKDGKLDNDDIINIANGMNNHILNFSVDLRYKNFQLYVMTHGAFGGYGFKNSAYYQFVGDKAVYSKEALKSFDLENPDPNAEYPRLSLGNSTNNYQNSTVWCYDASYVSIPIIQFGYNFKVKSDILKSMRVYLRGQDLFFFAKEKEHLQLNYGGSPKSRTLSLGFQTSF